MVIMEKARVFQSTHSRGVRLSGCCFMLNQEQISIHVLTRSATVFTIIWFIHGMISIHALTRSATENKNDLLNIELISIHALTRSATYLTGFGSVREMISIHALTRSATWLACWLRKRTSYFNPRTHEECDTKNLEQIVTLLISIHALTRSATFRLLKPFLTLSTFQSTHSRGVRRGLSVVAYAFFNFNPRTHEECDEFPFLLSASSYEFQSTHSRGVRPHHYSYQNEIDHISIHALTRSATSLLFLLLLVVYISIHALTRSATSKRYFYRSGWVFQSTHSRGVRH